MQLASSLVWGYTVFGPQIEEQNFQRAVTLALLHNVKYYIGFVQQKHNIKIRTQDSDGDTDVEGSNCRFNWGKQYEYSRWLSSYVVFNFPT